MLPNTYIKDTEPSAKQHTKKWRQVRALTQLNLGACILILLLLPNAYIKEKEKPRLSTLSTRDKLHNKLRRTYLTIINIVTQRLY